MLRFEYTVVYFQVMALAKDMAMIWAIIRVMAVGSVGVMVEQVTVIMVVFLAVRMVAEVRRRK